MLDQIDYNYNLKLKQLILLYRRNLYRILRLRIHPYYKRIYITRLRKYYLREKNKLDTERNEQIAKYKKEQSKKNNNTNNNPDIPIKSITNKTQSDNSNTDTNTPNFKNIKALMVGINYNNTRHQLKGCINDANNLKKFFSIRCGLQNKNVSVLTDQTRIKPTRTNIIRNYINLVRTSKPGDLLVFTYAGHGYYTRDRNGDEKDNRDELLVSIDFRTIKDDYLKYILNRYLPKDVKVFILFDCCNSGTLMDLKYNYLSTNNYDKIVVNNKSSETRGEVYFISGCRDDQQSADAYINKEYQGAMSWAFVKTISENKNLSWKDLLLGMRELLSDKYIQIPQLSSGKNMDINSKIFI